MSTRFTPQITAGIRLLDEHAPGWLSRIDLDTLDLRLPCRCVLGQTFGSFETGVVELDIWGESIDYGFDIDMTKDFSPTWEYAALTEAWRQHLRPRLAEARA